jgi:hypothetical protein
MAGRAPNQAKPATLNGPDPNHPMNKLGATDGSRLVTSAQCGEFMTVLSFGAAERLGPTSSYAGYGARLSATLDGKTHQFIGDDIIIQSAYQYAAGWFIASPACAKLRLVIGFSNYKLCGESVSRGCDIYEFGKYWGYVITDTVNAVDAKGWWSKVWVWAGADAETGYDTYARTRQATQGFNDNDPKYARLYDYGDASLSGTWTYDQIYDIAWGQTHNYNLMQIYLNGQINNMINLKKAHTSMEFHGVMSDCPQGGHLSPSGAWNGLWNAMNSNGIGQQSMPYSTQIGTKTSRGGDGCGVD